MQEKDRLKHLLPHYKQDNIIQILRLPNDDFDTIYYESGETKQYRKPKKF
jgi:hypothetical protein